MKESLIVKMIESREQGNTVRRKPDEFAFVSAVLLDGGDPERPACDGPRGGVAKR
jgi:hypothetical protein